MTRLENRCASCGGKLGLISHHHWGLRFLPQSLQGQLPCENGEGPCVYETVVRLLAAQGFVGVLAKEDGPPEIGCTRFRSHLSTQVG